VASWPPTSRRTSSPPLFVAYKKSVILRSHGVIVEDASRVDIAERRAIPFLHASRRKDAIGRHWTEERRVKHTGARQRSWRCRRPCRE
jgi:hypothetical protein